MTIMYCNVKLRKLLSAHKSCVRETSLFTGAMPNPVRNSQTSRFVSVPGQNPGRSSRGDSVVLRLRSVMMADVWWSVACRAEGLGCPPTTTNISPFQSYQKFLTTILDISQNFTKDFSCYPPENSDDLFSRFS